MRYEIDTTTFAIKIYQDGETVPFQFQPDYPNGDPFDSFAEAEIWALASIAAHLAGATTYAPMGKNLTPELQTLPIVAIAKRKLESGQSLSAEEIQALVTL
jgi:hypothetical protein